MADLGYLPKLKRGLGLAFGADVHDLIPHYSILYQWTKFQCHTFFAFQDIEQNVLLKSCLGS